MSAGADVARERRGRNIVSGDAGLLQARAHRHARLRVAALSSVRTAVRTLRPMSSDPPIPTVHVRYFAAARDLAGCAEEPFVLDADTRTAGALLALVYARHPALAPHAAKLRVALDGELCDLETPIAPGSELVLLPPVAGGAPAAARVRRAELSEHPLSLELCVRDVAHSGAGGIATFLGVVRDHADGLAVSRLDYEAWTERAAPILRRVLETVAESHPGAWLAAQHRVGSLAIGDTAVVVAASAPHRAEAFAACRAAIDLLKATVPIWKREWTPDGEARWVGWE